MSSGRDFDPVPAQSLERGDPLMAVYHQVAVGVLEKPPTTMGVRSQLSA